MTYEDKLNEFFYEGLDRQTSVYLFGSGATGNWVPGRSDLDLIVLVPEGKLVSLGQKARDWTWSSRQKLPILDGYVLYGPGKSPYVKRLDELIKVTYPSDSKIDLIDQWMIKNRSKLLFGDHTINNLFPEISIRELSFWAKAYLRSMFIGNSRAIVPEPKVVLSGLIWSVSWSARMLMLSRGSICESKREALQWLASDYPEVSNLVYLLLDDYLKSDDQEASITSEQSVVLREFCLELMRQESN